MRTAIGGERWNRFVETVAIGSVTMSGLKGNARFDFDLRSGRYAHHFDIAVMGRSDEVYDGATVWARDISGGVHRYDAWFPKARAPTDAFIIRGAYLQPKFGATYVCAGSRLQDGRSVTVIRVRPRGGIPAELAVDSQSHLLSSVTERFPITTRVTRYGDYRTVDGIVLPFSISQGTLLEPDDGFSFDVRRYSLERSDDATDFSRPHAAANAAMIGDAASTLVPAKLEGRQLLVWASIDGRASMPFILDTGGHAILTAGAAKALGLQGSGAGESGGAGAGTIGLQYTRVKSIRLGKAELFDQPMLVIPYPYSFYERGRLQPLAGILGLEVFEHFATRIDYGAGTVTLSPLSTFTRHGSGARVPMRFQDDMPMIVAAADGHAGMFGTDTGNAGSLILFGDFLKRTGLGSAYRGGALVVGHGTGGNNTGRLATLRAFTIGGHAIRNARADFTNMTRGSFSSWTEAGNAGYEVLSRFIPTFDYASESLYLDRCTSKCVPPRNRSGMAFEKDNPASFVIASVAPGSPAERAGLISGDRIVAIDGKPATAYSSADLWTLVSRCARVSLSLSARREPSKQSDKIRIVVLPIPAAPTSSGSTSSCARF
jgi:PDZ domain/Aspartyl protease